MKICQIYSNNNKFKWIKFNKHLNVILGIIKDKSNEDTDSHNLGKSTLIYVIDFMFLKEIKSNRDLFKKNYDRLKDFTFFMELKKDENSYVTIKRNVKNNTKISIKFHTKPFQDFRNEAIWDYTDLPLTSKNVEKNPKEILNNFFSFYTKEEYNFRKYLGYFLRTQYDYDEVFKLNKFKGKMINWKPALLDLLGFDGDYLKDKLALESQIELTKKYLEEMKEELRVSDYEIDVIHSLIEAKSEDKEKLEEEINRFDFYNKERENTRILVEDIESEISNLNNLEYKLSYEIEKINGTLKRDLDFDLEKVESIFNEAKILFGDQIKKSYNELVQFNEDIIQERNTYQAKMLRKKGDELQLVRKKLKELNDERKSKLAYIRNSNTMAKFKKYQNELVETENEISHLLNKLDNVDVIKSINKKLKQMDKDLEESIQKLEEHLEKPNDYYNEIKSHFRTLSKGILGESAILYYIMNTNDNPDFFADFVNINESKVDSQSDGYSYKKMLCVCFDLAVLLTYSKKRFFKFVYHDGAYESMSDTRKIKYLDKVREICDKFDIQYIFTTLSDDIPRGTDNKLYDFTEDEIALELSDDEDNLGRLFSMKF
ncbi:DUF2326 domain-containing protein [Alkalibacillus aidingensis]|uniref:DUF2326 domain-containing protein n=1 Tax=Alkalibacillus aidingensis TaxID=2747607 RepID=UPI0016613D7E|nr:DUF2326 domain-containing protein [Alkalibacillus aidingensis]